MESAPTISVIIPTFNRNASLRRTLDSLGRQAYPMGRLEVLVVDDGSSDDTPAVAGQPFPYALRYVRQDHQGATAARNRGAALSQANLLVFIDDDVTISPQTLGGLAEACWQRPRLLVTGRLHRRARPDASVSVYAAVVLASPGTLESTPDEVELSFVDCNTELLACRREDFCGLGMLHDPTEGTGWPNWDDVEFGYRAHRNGFRLLRVNDAVGEHWDYSILDRSSACQRWYRASRSAVWLFQRHRELRTLIPMLRDKTPLAWGSDPPSLMARKLARRVMSSRPALRGMERLANLLERHAASPALLRRLYDWIHGAHMVHGYRAGLREFALAGARE